MEKLTSFTGTLKLEFIHLNEYEFGIYFKLGTFLYAGRRWIALAIFNFALIFPKCFGHICGVCL